MSGGVAPTFARIAASVPDVLALRTSDRDVTYGELAALAGGLAGGLAGALTGGLAALVPTAPPGGGTADERSAPVLAVVRDAVDLAVATLAANAVGRPVAVVPADTPASVALRIAAALGATEAVLPPGLGALGELTAIALDGRHGSLTPVSRAADETVALVGTSGSTSAPRFVRMLEGRFADGAVESSVLSELQPGVRIATTFSTASAPFSIVLRSLLCGSTCSIIDVRRVPPSRALTLLRTHAPTRLRMVPSVMRSLLTGRDQIAPLEEVTVFGFLGERLHWQDVARVRAVVPAGAVITNGYGMTETGLLTERSIGPDEHVRTGVVDVGRPLAGRTVWIDPGTRRPAEPGEVGEIVVEGRFWTRGIVTEPLPGGLERFRTGDHGTLDPDGSLEHRGRRDRETKIAGHRVDVGAVEAVARDIPGVLGVAVVVEEETVAEGIDRVAGRAGAPRSRLVAHFHASRGLSETSLRRELSDRLVGPSVPAGIRIHDGPLPLLPSGKLDLRRLRRRTEDA
jgi:acyl-coenzyme A synthetase/AMP-(fatty) acid ligase